jgi:hypothetical protein
MEIGSLINTLLYETPAGLTLNIRVSPFTGNVYALLEDRDGDAAFNSLEHTSEGISDYNGSTAPPPSTPGEFERAIRGALTTLLNELRTKRY